MTSTTDPGRGDAPTSAIECKARVRAIYRDPEGAITTDFPVDKIRDAIAREGGALWIDVEDPGSADNRGVEAMFRDVFGFHALAIEDALQDTHVPKVDNWERYLYLVTCSIDFDPADDRLRLHELDIFLGANYLLTYHNEPLEVIDRHRKAIERDPEHRLCHGAAYLLYHLLDAMVAQYLPAIEHLDEAIDDAQDEVFDRPTPRTLQNIFTIKRAASKLHRMIGPMREVLNRLARDPYPVVDEARRVYFRDVYDGLVRIHDVSESLRDLIAGALDTYLSASANRTNDIMKTLTMVTVMFLPLSFLVGFFGMNFFGDTLMFITPPLPKPLLFWASMALMGFAPWLTYRWVRRRDWS